MCLTAYAPAGVVTHVPGIASAYTRAVLPTWSARPNTDGPLIGWLLGSLSSWTPKVEPPAIAR